MGSPQWLPFIERYRSGEWRAVIFRDMVLEDIQRVAEFHGPVVLDIGCGRGFDDDARLQASLAAEASQYIGVEPDTTVKAAGHFSELHRCAFEAAPIAPDSIDVAFAVMVLEHLSSPADFWERLHRSLRPGGVFWGFTIDARNWFAKASLLTELIGIKNWYLNRLHGTRGEQRYENYGVHYLSNTPEQIAGYTKRFKSMDAINFHTHGQLDYYLPGPLRWVGRAMDNLIEARGWPGSILAVRLEK